MLIVHTKAREVSKTRPSTNCENETNHRFKKSIFSDEGEGERRGGGGGSAS